MARNRRCHRPDGETSGIASPGGEGKQDNAADILIGTPIGEHKRFSIRSPLRPSSLDHRTTNISDLALHTARRKNDEDSAFVVIAAPVTKLVKARLDVPIAKLRVITVRYVLAG